MQRLLKYAGGLVLFALSSGALAWNPVQQSGWQYGPYQQSVQLGNYLYAAIGEAGFEVLDLQNPQQPQSVLRFGLEHSGTLIATDQQQTLYVLGLRQADAQSVLSIIDVSQATTPRILATLAVSGQQDLAVRGEFAYVLAANKLEIIQLSNPSQAEIIGQFMPEASSPTDAGFSDLAVDAQHAYLIGWDRGLSIVEISNPQAPTLAGSMSFASNPKGLLLDGATLYVGLYYSGFMALDVSHPAQPQALSDWAYGNYIYTEQAVYALGMAKHGDTLYLSLGAQGLQVLDVSDNTQPKWLGSLKEVPAKPYLLVAGQHLLLTSEREGLYVFDISQAQTPQMLGQLLPQAPHFTAIALQDNLAYALDAETGLHVFDLSGEQPQRLSHLPPSSSLTSFTDLAVRGHLAYLVGDYVGLQIVDISNPAQPQYLSTPGIAQNSFGAIKQILVQQEDAYLVTQGYGFYRVDLSRISEDASDLVQLIAMPGEGHRLAATAQRLYMVADGKLYIIDPQSLPRTGTITSAPGLPFEIADFVPSLISIQANYAYLLGYNGNYSEYALKIFDLQNPDAPELLGDLSLASLPNAVQAWGRYLLLTDASGLSLLDISDPKQAQALAHLDIGQFEGLAVAGDSLYLAQGEQQLTSWHLQPGQPACRTHLNAQGQLSIPCVEAGLSSLQQANLQQLPGSFSFDLDLSSLAAQSDADSLCAANYQPRNGYLILPCVDVEGLAHSYAVQLIQQSGSFRFDLEMSSLKTRP